MFLKVSPSPPFDSADSLVCAHCGGENIHHDQVEVYCRQEEDSTAGAHVEIGFGHKHADKLDAIAMTFDTNAAIGNPSERRDGVRILFWCEGCEGISELEIFQHKGWSGIRMVAGDLKNG